MLSFIVLVFAIAGVSSFPQNYGHEGNFGYDPFGGTFPQHLPPNPEFVPPVEYPAIPPHSKAKYGSYVPLIDGKPIYIPEVYHDGFVFRDMTLPDPSEPLQQWPRDDEANFYPQTSVKAEGHVKKVKPHHSRKKQRHYPKVNVGARSAVKKPVHEDYDEPVVVQSFSKMEKPIVRKHTYDYDSIKRFLEADHDFSKDLELPAEITLPNNIEEEVAIEVLTKKGKPAVNKKPIKHKLPPVDKPVYPEYEGHKVSVVDPFTKKVKPVVHKKPIKHKLPPVDKTVYPEYEGHEVSVVDPVKKVKPAVHKKPIKHKLPPAGKPIYPENEGHEISVVDPLTKKEKPVTHKKPVKQNPIVKTVYPEYEGQEPLDVDPLTKKSATSHKPIKHYEKPDGQKYVEHGTKIVEAFTGSENSVTHTMHEEEPVNESVNSDQEIAVVEAFSKMKKHEEKPVYQVVKDEHKNPVIVEAFSKKEKPVLEEDSEESADHPDGDHDIPVVVEVLTKKNPVTHKDKPVHVAIKVKEVIDEKEKHYSDEKDHDKHPDPLHVTDKDDVEVDYEPDDVEVDYEPDDELDDHDNKNVATEEKIFRSVDDSEYDYDTPEVVEVLTKKEKSVVSEENSENDVPNVVESLKKIKKHPEKVDDQKEEYEELSEVIDGEHHPHDKHPDHVLPLDKDDVEVDYEPVNEWADEDKDYELGDELESRGFEDSDDDSLGKDIDSFDGSGSVSDGSEKPEGRSFLPVDPSVWNLMSSLHSQERRKFKSCLTPRNESGNCMPIQMCAVPNFASNIDELLKNVCVIDEVFIGICCPEFPVDTIKVQWDQFVEQNKSESFNEESVRECGKLPEVVNKTIAWPWMAPLVAASTGKVFCGGALINEQYVLSAAHCTKKIPHNRILVRLGSLDGDEPSEEDFEVVEIKRHAQYNPRTMANDIALLKLSRRVPLGDFRGLICLPEDDDDYIDERAILLGWKGFSEKMDDIEMLNVISNENCQRKMGVVVADSVVCTQPRTEQIKCNDDSGAPLVIGKDKQFKVVGVLTWNRNDCDSRFPSIFTRVSEYRKWIQRHAV